MEKTLIAALVAAVISLTVVAADPGPVEVTHAWVRALPPGQANTAAYLTVTNAGPVAVTVVGATTGIADKVEIHRTREVDGYMRMEQLAQVELPAGGNLALAPGGTHLMLLGLEHMPAPGETVPLCLQLAEGEAVCTVAEVRKSAIGQPSHDHHHPTHEGTGK